MASTPVANLMVSVGADTSGATQALTGLSGMLGRSSLLALGALAVGAIIVGVGVATVKMAGDFQAGMESLVTGAGASQNQIAMLSAGVLQLAQDTGTSTTDIIASLYQINSANIHGAASLALEKDAAEGAKVGNADLSVVTGGLITIMKNYSGSMVTGAYATNVLIAGVANGNTHLQDLAGSLSTVLPAAAALHIPLIDVVAAMDSMTSHGIGADQAATYLRQTFLMLAAPTAAATTALNAVGLTTTQVADEMQKSLPGAIQMISNHIAAVYGYDTPAYVGAMKDIVGGTRSMQAILTLTSASGMADFLSAQKNITKSVDDGGTSITNWGIVQNTFNQKMSELIATVQVLMIELGQKLLPVMTQLATWLLANLVPAIQSTISYVQWISQNFSTLAPIVLVVGGMLGGLLVAALVAVAVAAWAALAPVLVFAAPFILIAAAIGLVIGVVILLVTHWQQLMTWFSQQGPIKATGSAFGDMGRSADDIIDIFARMINTIGTLIGIFNNLRSAIGNAVGAASNAVGGVLSHIPGFATGGTMPDTGLALVGEQGPELIQLPGGSNVTPLSGSNAISGPPSGMSIVPAGATGTANGQPILINLYVDKTKFGQVAASTIPSVLRNATGTRSF